MLVHVIKQKFMHLLYPFMTYIYLEFHHNIVLMVDSKMHLHKGITKLPSKKSLVREAAKTSKLRAANKYNNDSPVKI